MNWETIGFRLNKKMFEHSIKSGDLSHAYLFSGQGMIGKRTFALELAQKIVNQNVKMNPDIVVIDSKDSIAVESIREAKAEFAKGSYYGGNRVLIIDNAHMMTGEAQNALLKLLEEPNLNTVIILVTSRPDALLQTIKSRCQEIQFMPHDRKDFEKMFDDSKLSQSQQDFLYEFSHGSIGVVTELTENRDFGKIKEYATELVQLSNAPLHDRLIVAAELAQQERDVLQTKVLYWILYIHTKRKDMKSYRILEQLLRLHSMIGQAQFNAQLALENFAISI